MDPKNFDASNLTAWPHVQYAALQEHQANRSGQEAFEQQLHEARQADTAMPDEGPRHSPPPNVPSDGPQPSDQLMGALARSKLLPSEEVLINDEHDKAELRAAKRPRTVNNPQDVAIQLSETANSGGGGEAMPTATALQPAQSTGIVIGHDKRPLYSEDASAILGLQEALSKAGMVPKALVGALRGYSRWLFAKNKPSLVARLGSMSLSDGGDVYEFVGKGNPDRLLLALDRLRSFWFKGEVIVRRSGRAKDAPVVLGLEEALIKARTRRLDIAAAQLSASSALRPTESRGGVTGSDKRPLYSEDAPVVLGLEEALIKAGTARLDIAAAQLSASSALQPAQSKGVVTGSDMRPLYFEDARDISALQEAFIKAGMRASAYTFAGPLRSFSRWLFAKSKPSLVARLDSKSLSGDVSGFIGKGNPDRLLRAIDELRTFRSTGAQPNPHPPDVAPIHPESAVLMEPRLIGDAAAQHRHEASSRREELRERQEDQPAPLAFVQGHFAFDPEQIPQGELWRALDHVDGQSTPSAVSVDSEGLDRLEKELLDELHGRRDNHPAPSFSVDPEEFTFNPEQFSLDELRRLLDDQSIPSPVPLDPEDSALNSGRSPPNDLRLLNDEPALLGVASSAGPADQSAYEPGPLPNLSMYLPLDFQHGPQWASEDFMQGMSFHNLLPSASQPETNFPLNGVNYTATLGSPDHEDQVFLRPTFPDAGISASSAGASAGDRSGRVLGARQWLGDEHIQRDYELLSQELQQSNPNLAARTRLVDPLVAFQVGHGSDADALTAFHRVVNDRNGNDTADFLFLPVNDTTAEEMRQALEAAFRSREHRAISLGRHWSLLFVDRRDRDRPVAYHYDSARGHNAGPAATLAARVGADLQHAIIRQQRNGYDCGIFVVDGARALVRRLAGRRQADLGLGNLVIDRQALQNRLSG